MTHVDCCLWLLLVTHTVRKVKICRIKLLGKTVERVFKAQADFAAFFKELSSLTEAEQFSRETSCCGILVTS